MTISRSSVDKRQQGGFLTVESVARSSEDRKTKIGLLKFEGPQEVLYRHKTLNRYSWDIIPYMSLLKLEYLM